MRKPFSSVELLARIEAVMRRTEGRSVTDGRPLVAGNLTMDFGSASVYVGREVVPLTRTEMNILEQLARNGPRTVTYESLAKRSLDVAEASEPENRTIRVHVQRLRSKLGDSVEAPTYIANVRGVGYRFVAPITDS